MNKLRPGQLFGIFLAIVALAGAGWLLFSNTDDPDDTDWTTTPPPEVDPGTDPENVPLPPDSPTPPKPNPSPSPPTASPDKLAEWEATISNALADDSISNEQAVDRLLVLAADPTVDETVRLDATEHALNLTEDETFSKVMPIWKDPATPVDMLDSILSDLYNRGDRVKLEAVLEAAKVANHPLHEDNIELLEFYVDENYGDDWDAWGEAVNTYFVENEVE